MLAKSVSVLAVLTFAAHVGASEPVPYKPIAKMSIHQMFGLGRRQDNSGYQPTQSVCGTGATCAEACGAGYTTCTSTDSTVHCYNPDAKQTCCPDGTGNSCDDGYYCTADKTGQTWCCPNSMDLVACAAAYSVTGGLVSETPKPTSTSSSSSMIPSITSTSANTTMSIAKNATVYATQTGTVTTCTSTLKGSASFPTSNTTTKAGPSASSTPSQVGVSGASVAGPIGLLSLLAAAAVAALL